MSNLKLVVEVASAHDLMSKDGQGSANPYVKLHFGRQKYRTTVKEKDLNPCWNETFYFNISDPNNLPDLTLDAYVYNSTKGTNSKSFMGKVHINGTSFVPYSDALVLHYPLEKKNMFSHVQGELGLKVFVTDNPSIRTSNPNESKDSKPTFHHQIQSKRVDCTLKETSPFLGGGQVIKGRFVGGDNRRGRDSTRDLVETMQYIFVRVVKAQDLPRMDILGSLDPYVEVCVGNYKGSTKHVSKSLNPEWNTVFAFSKEQIQATVLDVVVKDKDSPTKDDFVGTVRVNLKDVPTRVPSDIPLAPQWYRIEDKIGNKRKGELMLAVWIGTQGDEAFPYAFSSENAMRNGGDDPISPIFTRSIEYQSPRLWYVRVNVIEVLDLVCSKKGHVPDVYVRGQTNDQVLKTRRVQSTTGSALWNENMMFVTAEPFDDHLLLTVVDHVGPDKDEMLGTVVIPLNKVATRADNRMIQSEWFNLQDPLDGKVTSTWLHLRVCLDGGYHVHDEPMQYTSDLRPSDKQLWRPSIGIIELGILNATGIQPMKMRHGKGTTDAYCVAKYGPKWVRTRTIIDSLVPKFNEQYTWEVYDPSTVLTIGLFDDSLHKELEYSKDKRIGKIRIRLSTLETGRVYTHLYPLLRVRPSGVQKMGELHLAIRFSSTSMMNMMHMYSKPLLPKMHYLRPLTVAQHERLRHQAVGIVAARLSRAEPPLRKEIIKYMTDADRSSWSMRRTKANFFRGLALGKWLGEVCLWKNPITTVLVHILFVMLVSFPELLALPMVFLFMFLMGLWNYWFRAQHPSHIETRLSYADVFNPDELDEEFDGDIASQGERLQGLLSWRDPRASVIFMVFCLLAAFVLYMTPSLVLVTLGGFYVMRHPRFRHRLPSAPMNFFGRL